MGTKGKQNGIKYPKVEQEAIKVEQSGVKNPKVETREDQSGTEWDREPKSGNKNPTGNRVGPS